MMAKKPKDPTDTNIADDIFHKLIPERKDRSPASKEDEDEEYYKRLEAKKRARYEALKEY
jgi:flagellar motility protein MotE (MotC chaperone)